MWCCTASRCSPTHPPRIKTWQLGGMMMKAHTRMDQQCVTRRYTGRQRHHRAADDGPVEAGAPAAGVQASMGRPADWHGASSPR